MQNRVAGLWPCRVRSCTLCFVCSIAAAGVSLLAHHPHMLWGLDRATEGGRPSSKPTHRDGCRSCLRHPWQWAWCGVHVLGGFAVVGHPPPHGISTPTTHHHPTSSATFHTGLSRAFWLLQHSQVHSVKPNSYWVVMALQAPPLLPHIIISTLSLPSAFSLRCEALPHIVSTHHIGSNSRMTHIIL